MRKTAKRVLVSITKGKWPRQLSGGAEILGLEPNTNAVAKYWTDHNVTFHHKYASADESLAYVHWRNDLYFGYIDMMPVRGHDGKVVLDYGCGPGHDLVGFGVYSKPKRIIGMDLSPTSLAEARDRMALHGVPIDLVQLESGATRLPVDNESIDLIHSSGVLHHTPDPEHILTEFARVLKPGGAIQIMVYNYDSIWLHLHVAYHVQIIQGKYRDLDVRTAFSKCTDGEECPISNVYRPEEFLTLAKNAGLDGTFVGAAISMSEASLVRTRYDAICDRRMREESRRFLLELEFDKFGFPLYRGTYAGCDGCYRFTRNG